jgi:hypothetical protein
MFSIPLMVLEAFSISVMAAQIATLDPLMATSASTIIVLLPGLITVLRVRGLGGVVLAIILTFGSLALGTWIALRQSGNPPH